MLHCNGKHTPFPSNTEYHKSDSADTELPDNMPRYWQLVGDLRYIADSTRRDIAYVVGRLAAAITKPTVRRWNIMKATLRYLRKTRNFGLHFGPRPQEEQINATSATKPLTTCADADWANDKQDRRSITGGFFTWHGKPIG